VSAAANTASTNRRQVLTDLRRNEILAAAIKVFGKKGFAATCVEDIASAADIAKGTLYLYFESKQDIYATAVRLAFAQLQALTGERIKSVQGVRDRLAVAISVRLDFWHQQRNLYRLLITVGREPQHKGQTHELLRLGHEQFLAILKEGRAAGEIPKLDAGGHKQDLDALAWAILDMVRGCSERRVEKQTGSTPQEDAAWIATFALRQLGLAAHDHASN
jgi:AcrR family transcriptional regulator